MCETDCAAKRSHYEANIFARGRGGRPGPARQAARHAVKTGADLQTPALPEPTNPTDPEGLLTVIKRSAGRQPPLHPLYTPSTPPLHPLHTPSTPPPHPLVYVAHGACSWEFWMFTTL
eukprot:1182849-Prorocentrum_minimum.AAC.1